MSVVSLLYEFTISVCYGYFTVTKSRGKIITEKVTLTHSLTHSAKVTSAYHAAAEYTNIFKIARHWALRSMPA
jgi:hypothetical protein